MMGLFSIRSLCLSGIVVLLLAVACPGAKAQVAVGDDSVKTRKLIGLKLHYGSVLIHSRDLRPIKDSYPLGASADIAWQFLGKKSWEFCNCYPRAGLILTTWDFDNRPILGYGFTAMTYVEPVFLTRHRINLSIRLAGGIAFLTNPFDSTSNPFNQSYSTYLNVPLAVGVGLHFRVTDQWTLRLGADFNHVSNGGVNLPNKGINWPAINLGVDYASQPYDFKTRARRLDRSPPEKRFRLQVGTFYSFKNAIPGQNKQYSIFGLYGKGIYYLGRWSGLSLGTEWVMDRSRRIRMDNANAPGTHQRGSILVGHQFLLGRVVFSQELGVYYLDQFKVNDPVYQRFGLLVFLNSNLFVGVSLKTHLHVADFADLRVGWEF